ncbi:MAG: type II toxin-antitoxin system YafQ family toxin [Candidatus Pacebacteria bacterium]|nr:type II toxin-antitoxin system YafQ family toxin [Candidatus Paceibacterota bacterium]
MFLLFPTSQFKKDLRLYKHDSLVLCELKKVLDLLAKNKKIPIQNKNHQLKGLFVGCFDCHIKPDVILIYKKEGKIIYLLRIGSHSKIF